MQREICTSIEIDAHPDSVWSVLADFQRYGEWNPFIVSAEGAPQAGQRLRLRMRAGGRTFAIRPTVSAVQPGRTLRWIGHLGVPGVFDGEHLHQLEPIDGGTRYVQSERFSGVLVPFLGKTLKQTQLSFEAMNRALKHRAETIGAAQAPAPLASERREVEL